MTTGSHNNFLVDKLEESELIQAAITTFLVVMLELVFLPALVTITTFLVKVQVKVSNSRLQVLVTVTFLDREQDIELLVVFITTFLVMRQELAQALILLIIVIITFWSARRPCNFNG